VRGGEEEEDGKVITLTLTAERRREERG